MKKFVVRIGYVEYAVEQDDAAELLAIASRARAVERPNYDGPYYVKKEQEQFVDNLQLSEVIEEKPMLGTKKGPPLAPPWETRADSSQEIPDPEVAAPPPKPEFPF
jgi:hypothetical protein